MSKTKKLITIFIVVLMFSAMILQADEPIYETPDEYADEQAAVPNDEMIAEPADEQAAEPRFGPLTEPFFNQMMSDRFHISGTMLANANTTEISIYRRGNNFAQVLTVQGQRIRMVMRDGYVNIIVDSQRSILRSPIGETDIGGATDFSELVFVESGTARFSGRRRDFEEYTFGGQRIQYFVDGDRLLGWRMFEGRNATAEMMIREMNQRIPGTIFDIPAGFTVREVENFRF